MGNYATTTSIYTFLIGTDSDTQTTALIGKCIEWAENEVNKKLAKRYDVSAFLPDVPPQVRSLTEELAVAYFHFHNSRGSKESITRYKELRKFPDENLDELAAGKCELVNTAGAVIVNPNAPGVLCSTSDYEPTFDEGNELNWRVDRDKLEDIRDSKD